MNPEFWYQRWVDGLIGWHQQDVHPMLVKYLSHFDLQPGDKVFVPLCGKSKDMQWLVENDLQVIGSELSPIAVEQFFDEINLIPEKSDEGNLVRWTAGSYTLYEGDFFQLQPGQLHGVKFIYDRAALISMPKDGDIGRKSYVKKYRELFPVDTKSLLITLEYDQEGMSGPPFSVGYEEVVWQYAYDHIIEFLADEEILDQEQKFRERGLSSLTERAYALTRYEPIYAAFLDLPQDF